MQSVFIKSGNQIFNREHVCGVQYNTFNEEIINYASKLTLYTVNGKEIVFYNKHADILWEVFNDSSLDLTPNPVVAGE